MTTFEQIGHPDMKSRPNLKVQPVICLHANCNLETFRHRRQGGGDVYRCSEGHESPVVSITTYT